MRHALVAVDDRARKVVHGVHLPLGAGPVMGGIDVAAVDDGVSHGLVRVVDREFGADAVLLALHGALLHLLEDAQVLLDGPIAPLGSDALPPLVAHGLLVGVVRIPVALLDHANTHVVKVVEVVRGIREHVGLDAHQGKILDDGILVLLLLLIGVRVVETQAQRPLVGLMSEVVAQEGGLGVSNVQVSPDVSVSGRVLQST